MSEGRDHLRATPRQPPPPVPTKRGTDYRVELADGTFDAWVLLDDILVTCGTLRRQRRKRWVDRHGKPLRGWRPALTIRRTRGSGISGHAKVASGAIHVNVGPGVDSVRFAEVLLHEAAHAVGPKAEHHGRKFKLLLCRAAAEYFDIEISPKENRRAYGLDDIIIERARAAGWTPQRGRV